MGLYHIASRYWFINSLGTDTHTHTNTITHIPTLATKQFLETSCAPACGWHVPSLKSHVLYEK